MQFLDSNLLPWTFVVEVAPCEDAQSALCRFDSRLRLYRVKSPSKVLRRNLQLNSVFLFQGLFLGETAWRAGKFGKSRLKLPNERNCLRAY